MITGLCKPLQNLTIDIASTKSENRTVHASFVTAIEYLINKRLKLHYHRPNTLVWFLFMFSLLGQVQTSNATSPLDSGLLPQVSWINCHYPVQQHPIKIFLLFSCPPFCPLLWFLGQSLLSVGDQSTSSVALISELFPRASTSCSNSLPYAHSN